MAFDISIEETKARDAPPPPDFESFVEQSGRTLSQGLWLATDDEQQADRALRSALIKTGQRWKQVQSQANLLGWAFGVGVADADQDDGNRAPTGMNEATGGYVRGLPLDEAVAALPLQQRATLVGAYWLGWSDGEMASAFAVREETNTTRRTRALTFLGHHRHVSATEAAELVTAYFSTRAADREPQKPDASSLRRSGRRRTIRNRLGAALLVALIIAAGATLVQVTRRESAPVAEGPDPVPGPSNSGGWFPPVPDGRGGFTALNTLGSSRFANSSDGESWFALAPWNSRAIDLRTEVTSFSRTGGRFIATVEAAGSIRSDVPPRLATSNDLVDWSVVQIELEQRPVVEGIRSRAEIIGLAAAGPATLVGIEWVDSIDYRALDLTRTDVCVEKVFDAVRALYTCDGNVVTIERRQGGIRESSIEFFLARNGGPFEQVVLPERSDARTLVSSGAGFAVVDIETGRVSRSVDGKSWTTDPPTSGLNRFVLLEGDSRTSTMSVQPMIDQWQSVLQVGDAEPVVAEIGLGIDPAVVWTKPDLASGPAGWALFVTTSRPWERSADSPGWAVETGQWVVSRLPDSDTISAQDRRTSTSYRFSVESPAVSIADDGSVLLSLVDREDEVVEVSQRQIEQSRSITTSDEPKAFVFFSEDGNTWRSIWETNEEAWFGTVAVGDDEVLISGVTLTGAPIAVQLG